LTGFGSRHDASDAAEYGMTVADRVALTAVGVVLAAWIAFFVVMTRRPNPPGADGPARRDRRSMVGIGIQGVSYSIVWSPRYFGFARLVIADAHPWSVASIAWLVAIALSFIGGIVLLNSAVQALGRQWSLVARVASGHNLVTSGPYAHVRHPIYTAMLIMLVATGLALSGPLRLAIALAFFTAGTALRVRIEETLLRAAFGAAFDDYARRVPAVVPRPRVVTT
jgi:protein-S-isoprenylcysteine O-methyltransferase Ste14